MAEKQTKIIYQVAEKQPLASAHTFNEKVGVLSKLLFFYWVHFNE